MITNCPIVINNYNRLSTTKKMCEDLIRLGYGNIIILDNQSTYPELLKWYEDIKDNPYIRVELLEKNFGHKALWNSGYIDKLKDWEYIVLTDSDLELNKWLEKGFVEDLIRISKEFKFDKVGLAIEINDLPDNFVGKIIRGTEASYWINKLKFRNYDIYQGMIDTTFAVIKPTVPFTYHALRVAGRFTCKHIPWYINYADISKEDQYVLDTSDENICTLKQHYKKWLSEQPLKK